MTQSQPTRPAYRLERPQKWRAPFVVASPHSGRHYPWSFIRATELDEREIRSSEDAFVDMLLGDVPALGLPLLVAEYPRAYVDLNRAADELDAAVIEGVQRIALNPRIASGLGVIPRVVAGGRSIYRGKIPRCEARERIEAIWHPYHQALNALIEEGVAQFGEAVLLDMHSMPNEAIDTLGGQLSGVRPDVVLGDRFGASAQGDFVDRLEAGFREAGLVVSRNTPFAGAYIAQHYGSPARCRHAIQIEINRSLYMNEAMIRPNGNFSNVKKLLTRVIGGMVGGDALSLVAE